MTERLDSERLNWAIGARERSQRLLLALYNCSETRQDDLTDTDEGNAFLLLVGVAFSLWRAAFLADVPRRTFREALNDARDLMGEVLKTNTVLFGKEQNLQRWTGGFYLNNAKLRLAVAMRLAGRSTTADIERVNQQSLLDSDPQDSWRIFCEEAERLAQALGASVVAYKLPQNVEVEKLKGLPMANKDTKHTITRGAIDHILTLVRDIDANVRALEASGADKNLLGEIKKDSSGIFHTINENTPEQK